MNLLQITIVRSHIIKVRTPCEEICVRPFVWGGGTYTSAIKL